LGVQLHLGHRGFAMSRKANCYDNAMIESFWSTLKTESTARKHFKTRAEARLAVFDFIECFFNPHRRHSSIGGVSPAGLTHLKLPRQQNLWVSSGSGSAPRL
jgi:putative transposase